MRSVVDRQIFMLRIPVNVWRLDQYNIFINRFKDSLRTLYCTHTHTHTHTRARNISVIHSNQLILFTYTMALVCCVCVELQCRWEDVDIFNIKACDLYHNHCLWRDEMVINNWFMIIILTGYYNCLHYYRYFAQSRTQPRKKFWSRNKLVNTIKLNCCTQWR